MTALIAKLMVSLGLLSSLLTPQMPLGAVPCKEDGAKNISERIKTCPIPQTERPNFKGKEIAKFNHKGVYDDLKYGVRVEIVGLREISGGVEVFAKAWKNGKQLGFGADGTVETERFRIFNPPILVFDVNGDIVRNSVIEGKPIEYRLREDPVEAIRQSLAHTISLVGREGTKIKIGSIGNTTSTFYPAAGENSPVDGRIYKEALTWAGARDAVTGTAAEPTTSNASLGIDTGAWGYAVLAGFMLYDTSAIGTDVISSVTHSFYSNDAGTNTDSDSFATVETAPASDSTLVVGDYDSRVFVDLGNVAMPASAGGYNDMTLNATGLTKINKTGISKLGVTTLRDINNQAPTGRNSTGSMFYADQAGTTQDPKLVVVHAAAGGGSAPIQDIIYFE